MATIWNSFLLAPTWLTLKQAGISDVYQELRVQSPLPDLPNTDIGHLHELVPSVLPSQGDSQDGNEDFAFVCKVDKLFDKTDTEEIDVPSPRSSEDELFSNYSPGQLFPWPTKGAMLVNESGEQADNEQKAFILKFAIHKDIANVEETRVLTGADGTRQALCVHVFYNGVYCTSRLVPFDILNSQDGQWHQLAFHGLPISPHMERGWVIPRQKSSTIHSRGTAEAVTRTRTARWSAINTELSKSVNSDPSSLLPVLESLSGYVAALNAHPMPQRLDQSSNQSFAVFDIVVTVGNIGQALTPKHSTGFQHRENDLDLPTKKTGLNSIDKRKEISDGMKVNHVQAVKHHLQGYTEKITVDIKQPIKRRRINQADYVHVLDGANDTDSGDSNDADDEGQTVANHVRPRKRRKLFSYGGAVDTSTSRSVQLGESGTHNISFENHGERIVGLSGGAVATIASENMSFQPHQYSNNLLGDVPTNSPEVRQVPARKPPRPADFDDLYDNSSDYATEIETSAVIQQKDSQLNRHSGVTVIDLCSDSSESGSDSSIADHAFNSEHEDQMNLSEHNHTGIHSLTLGDDIEGSSSIEAEAPAIRPEPNLLRLSPRADVPPTRTLQTLQAVPEYQYDSSSTSLGTLSSSPNVRVSNSDAAASVTYSSTSEDTRKVRTEIGRTSRKKRKTVYRSSDFDSEDAVATIPTKGHNKKIRIVAHNEKPVSEELVKNSARKRKLNGPQAELVNAPKRAKGQRRAPRIVKHVPEVGVTERDMLNWIKQSYDAVGGEKPGMVFESEEEIPLARPFGDETDWMVVEEKSEKKAKSAWEKFCEEEQVKKDVEDKLHKDCIVAVSDHVLRHFKRDDIKDFKIEKVVLGIRYVVSG